MKVLIARMNHETNTFSPVPTPLAAFGPLYGDDAYRDNHGGSTAMSAFIDLAQARGAEPVTPLSAWANPSGPVHADAYDAMATDRPYKAALPVEECEAVLRKTGGKMYDPHLIEVFVSKHLGELYREDYADEAYDDGLAASSSD